MSEIRELYQEVILDHYKKPRNFHSLEDPCQKAAGDNPLCGDKITVFLRAKDGKIEELSFEGAGCAISTASASLMTESLKGKPVEEAKALFGRFHKLVTAKMGEEIDTEGMEKLAAFSGVREFPLRVKCASLAWHTLMAALDGKAEAITTE